MSLTAQEKVALLEAVERLTPDQQQWVKRAVLAFGVPRKFWRNRKSDVVTDKVLAAFGDRLITHHAGSRQALSKDRFEFAFEAALNDSQIPAQLVNSRTNRGHDITINGVPTSLKTEAATGIRKDYIHVSKWMELGKGEWKLPLLLAAFLDHMKSYERIFTLRCLSTDQTAVEYELLEIPKALLLEAETSELEVREDSRQNPKPGYGYVRDHSGNLKFALYFDGGTERKLQIKNLQKELCVTHATWTFGSAVAG